MVVSSSVVNTVSAAVRRNTELILGPYRAGKTTLLLNQIMDYCQSNPLSESLIVVPSHRYKGLLERRLRKIFLERSSKKAARGFVGLKIVTFQKLCEQILRKDGAPFKLVPQSVRPILIAKCMERLKEEGVLNHISGMVEFAGSQQSVLELIDEFERAALTPSDLVRLLEKTAHADSRYMELAHIYSAYTQELVQLKLTDEKGLAFRTREYLHCDAAKIEFGFVAVDGFDRFNTLQLQVLSGLSRYCHHLKVCFDYLSAQQDPLQEYVWKETSFLELNKTLAGHCRIKNMDRAEVVAQRSTKKFRAIDRQFEFDHIARLIKAGMLEEGRMPGDFIVVARNVKPYRSAIAAAFEAAGVAYFIDEPVSLSSLPVVQMIIRLLSLAQQNFVRKDVIECLRSPYFSGEAFGIAAADVEYLDQVSLEINLVSGIEQWREIWGIGAGGTPALPGFEVLPGEALPGEALPGADSLFVFFNTITPAPFATYHQFVAWVEDVCARSLNPLDEGKTRRTHTPEEERALAELRKILATLIHEENVMGAATHSVERLLSRLQHLIDRANFRRTPTHSNCVVISGADLAPNILVEEVFVAGLCDGEFPKRGVKHGLVSNEEIAKWSSFGVNLHNPRYHPAFELALFNSLLQRAKSRVHLSCALSDIGGEELTPSFFITEGASDFATNCPVLEPFAHSSRQPVSARDYLSAMAWSASPGGISGAVSDCAPEPENTHPEIACLAQKIETPLTVALARAFGPRKSPFNGYLCDYAKTGMIAVDSPKKWSASKLTEYGKCPFRYWMSHLLKANPHEEPESALSDKLLGETYHKALEIFYTQLLRRGIRMRPASYSICAQIFEQSIGDAVHWLESQSKTRQGEFWQFNLTEIKFRLRRFFEEEFASAQTDPDNYEPAHVEARFGFDDGTSFPALAIHIDEKEILLCGKIDRIDLAQDGTRARVIDYKKGSAYISDEDALSGRNMQLPIYALATQRAIMPGINVVEAKYLSVSAAKANGKHYFDGRKKRGENPPELASTTEDNIVRIVDAIASGDFSVAPSNADVCTSCDHKSICRLTEVRQDSQQSSGGAACPD